jgi:tetratricopeptide (TPR) repeat protein
MRKNRAWVGAIAGLSVAVAGGCASTHEDRAQSFYSQGRLEDADHEIDQALSDDPDDPTIATLAAQIFTQEGVAKYNKGDYTGAGVYFHRSIDYAPTYGPAYEYLGLIAFAEHNWRDAISYGSEGASYSGLPVPDFVGQARAEQRKVENGNMFTKHGANPPSNAGSLRGDAR